MIAYYDILDEIDSLKKETERYKNSIEKENK
jgi:hypothetical protein